MDNNTKLSFIITDEDKEDVDYYLKQRVKVLNFIEDFAYNNTYLR